VPEEPENDDITRHIIEFFRLVNRSRQYVVGMKGAVAMPLSVADINTVAAAYHSPLPRRELDACIFALDKEWRASLE